jgi:hypothetical protein
MDKKIYIEKCPGENVDEGEIRRGMPISQIHWEV